jgi:predicted NAD/FAD-binding protein
MERVAIVGAGIAGLGCAHFLQRRFDLTLYERNDYAGGHSHTVEVAEGAGAQARRLPIDTGFMVFNRVTYPLLTRLFERLGVEVRPTSMSFSVRHVERDLEFCGSSLPHLFAQRRNLLRPGFYRLLAAIDRFNREAAEALDRPETAELTLAEYAARRGYGRDFLDLYLVPMSSAVWSTPPELMLEFPAATLLRFFHNHGFLGLRTQHPWLTVAGGARAYVAKLTAPWRGRIALARPAARVRRGGPGPVVVGADGEERRFDRVILACHGDEALQLLEAPTAEEARLLGEFRYQPNQATVHTDASVMPRTRRAWASWNYQISRAPGGGVATATHYWMNSLQGVSDRENYFVTIGRPDGLAPGRILRRLAYHHPLFSRGAVRAQAGLPGLNAAARGGTETYFAGSYFRYGFHEDALRSAADLAQLLLGSDPWENS